jgi:hypothetical protein
LDASCRVCAKNKSFWWPQIGHSMKYEAVIEIRGCVRDQFSVEHCPCLFHKGHNHKVKCAHHINGVYKMLIQRTCVNYRIGPRPASSVTRVSCVSRVTKWPHRYFIVWLKINEPIQFLGLVNMILTVGHPALSPLLSSLRYECDTVCAYNNRLHCRCVHCVFPSVTSARHGQV